MVCTNGMDVDLNYSLLPDGIVAGGDAWRNPSTQALLMYTNSAVTKNRAVVSGQEFGEVPNFATDVFDGMSVMDVGDFEDLDAAVGVPAIPHLHAQQSTRRRACVAGEGRLVQSQEVVCA